ncbi:hypothetical protein [Desulfitobacterium sp. Sab5]|uniref:hypothetical protein n=1 Tax=Desulfitobacterium TaxID=36853 RepID=UPI003CF344D9
MFKFLWRIFVVLVFLFLIKTTFSSQTEAYITWPEKQNWVERVKYQVDRIQQDAQDLPANVEIELKRLWKDVKPKNDAKLV